MTEEERKLIIEDYANKIGQVLYGERNWWDKLWNNYPSIIDNVDYNANGFGVSYGNGNIAINSSFISDPTKNYSVDKVIDTLTHEIRHQYQTEVKHNPDKYAAPEVLLGE